MTERTELQKAIDEAVESLRFAASFAIVEVITLGRKYDEIPAAEIRVIHEAFAIAARVSVNEVAIKALDVAENAAHAAIAGMEARVKGETNAD